jgi:glycosyltransferase involved in cell wall biosynthesis
VDGGVNLSSLEVSVVMSVYNGAKYLRESVESILSQEGVDLEFIIVNDGSTDDSGNILAEYAVQDHRIRIIEQENKGLTRSLIRGCNEAQGKYIARQDVGDFSLPGRLNKLLNLMQTDHQIVFVSSWALMLGPKHELLCEIQRSADAKEATDLLLHHRVGPPHHGSVMFRKNAYEKVGGYRSEFYYSQDSDLWLRLGEIGLITYCPEFLYAFQYKTGCISSIRRPVQKQLGQIAHECRDARLKSLDESPLLYRAASFRPPFKPPLNKDIARGPYFIAGCLRVQGNRKALDYYRLALKYRPCFLPAWFWMIWSWLFGKKITPYDQKPQTFTLIDHKTLNNGGG